MVKCENAKTKKAYVRPQLVKHGNVETLTQHFNWQGFSGPISYPR